MFKSVKKSNRQPILLEIVEEPINTECDYYTIARSPYIKSEFIPSNIIPIVMKHFFESSELVLSYNENHAIYKIMIKDLLVNTIQNWEFNRPPDMARCPDIVTHIYKFKKPIDTLLYLSFTPLDI